MKEQLLINMDIKKELRSEMVHGVTFEQAKEIVMERLEQTMMATDVAVNVAKIVDDMSELNKIYTLTV